MNQSNPNSEPTMDEILASIRKIISEDQPEAEQEQKAEGESSLQMPEPELPPEPPPEPTIEEPLAAELSEPIGMVRLNGNPSLMNPPLPDSATPFDSFRIERIVSAASSGRLISVW